MPNAIPEVDAVGLSEVLLAEDRAVLVDFWSQWCAPCRTMRPFLEQMAEDYSDTCRVVAIDVEKHEAASEEYDVMMLPTLLLLHNGNTILASSGQRCRWTSRRS